MTGSGAEPLWRANLATEPNLPMPAVSPTSLAAEGWAQPGRASSAGARASTSRAISRSRPSITAVSSRIRATRSRAIRATVPSSGASRRPSSVRTIALAPATGTAHGLVYHYFDSKDELLAAILKRYTFLPHLRELLAVSPDRPAAEVLADIATGFSRMLDERTDLLRVVVAESDTNPVVAEALGRVSEEGLDLLSACLQARIAAGDLRPHDPTVPARTLFWAIITSHLGQASVDGFETDLVALLLDGLRAR